MKLPYQKLEEVEYYEVETGISSRKNYEKVMYDKITLHFGEYEVKYKLFGIWTIFTKTNPDRTKTFEFERSKKPKNLDKQLYEFTPSKAFVDLYTQLENYFEHELPERNKKALKVVSVLKDLEMDYLTKKA